MSGASNEKPKYINVRMNSARSLVFLSNHTSTRSQPHYSSAYSRIRTKISLEPSGNAPLGTCRTSVSPLSSSWPDQLTSTPLTSSATNATLDAASSPLSCTFARSLLATHNTVGSVLNPTPLPSVHSLVTSSAAWETSGIPPEAAAQTNTVHVRLGARITRELQHHGFRHCLRRNNSLW
jgi:hypothetical protein